MLTLSELVRRSKLLCVLQVVGYTSVTEEGENSQKGKISRKRHMKLLTHVLLSQERTSFHTYAIALEIFRSNPKTLQIV